jgi:ElaB/YqjD/DUF883 family membrane-anchored ribosome-binding protein
LTGHIISGKIVTDAPKGEMDLAPRTFPEGAGSVFYQLFVKGGNNKMAKKLTPEEVAKKHADRLTADLQAIRDGINRVTENPMEKAAQKEDKMLQNLTKAVKDGKWKAGLMRTNLSDWQQRTSTIGVDRIPEGIAAAHDKQVQFYTELQEHQRKLDAKIGMMPDLTLQNNIDRAVAQIRGMSKFKRRG